MRSQGATQRATKVVIISIMFMAAMIFMGGIVGVLNSTVNSFGGDNIRSVYSSQVSKKKIPFSSLLKKDFTLEEISVLAGCDEYLESVMPIPSPTDFAHLQTTYDLIVGENNSKTWAELKSKRQKYGHVQIKYSPGKGRGSFVKRDYKKNEIVLRDVTACFSTTDYRDYLLYISDYSVILLCDVLLWTYAWSDCPPGGKSTLCLNLGGGGVMNDNRIDPTMGEPPEDSREEWFGPTDLCEKMGSTFFYMDGMTALRDIKAGEELTSNYEDWKPEDAAMGFGKYSSPFWNHSGG